MFEIARLLEHFPVETVLKRPTFYLNTEPRNQVLKRANYALKHERGKLPKITPLDYNKRWIKGDVKWFMFEWPKRSSKWQGGSPEYYDKENKKLSGKSKAFKEFLTSTLKKVTEEMKKSL